MGTVAAGSVSLDKAELMSLFSEGGEKTVIYNNINQLHQIFFHIHFWVFFLHMYIVFLEQQELW